MLAPSRLSLVLHAVLLVAGVLLAGAPARAQQVQPVAPYFVVVTSEDAMLRSGPSDLRYPIAKLTRNELLRVDGEGSGWARVGYPPGAAAFIPGDSFQPESGGHAGTVTRPTKLKAVNLTTGPRGSWQDVLDAPLPSGTKLSMVDPEPTPDGRGGNYFKVAPPDSARAYVVLNAVRKATQEEINQAMAAQGTRPQEGPRGATGPRPVTPRSTTGATGATGATGDSGATGRTLTEPMVPGSGQPAGAPAGATGESAATGATGFTGTGPEARPVEIPPSPYERLEAAFEAVRKAPPEQAEYGELMAELQKAIQDVPESPQAPVIRAPLQQRLDYLKLLTDLREQRQKLAQLQGTFKDNDEIVRKRLEDLDRVRQYTIVGRLSASTLYNGESLPLMYRIQTVGGPNPRTLAYLKPDPKLGIGSKLGQVVGVVGEANMDPTLRLNIITPLRVDVLEPASPPGTPAAAPSGATGATGPGGATGATGATGQADASGGGSEPVGGG